MKSVKKWSVVLSAAILCGVVTFSACKKDDDKDSDAVSLAKKTCDCAKQTTEEAQFSCLLGLAGELSKYMDLTTGTFKDTNFEKEYTDYLTKNCASALEGLGE